MRVADQIIEAVEPFDTFYRNHYRSVLAVVVALTKDRSVAEDVAQDAFIRAQRRWDEVGEYDYKAAWVKRVAINLATSRFRRLSAETRALLRVGQPPSTREPAEPSDEVWAAVRQLPRLQSQCVALFYVDDLSIAQIAELLGTAEGTVKSSLSRARQTLAETLGDHRGF